MYRTDAETIKYFCKMQSDTQIEFLNKDFPRY